jgi:outer membrane protein assembly factor BamD
MLLLVAGGCGQKGARLQKSVVPPDKTLFETANEYLHKNQFIKARLAFQTLINSYPDSDLNADAYLAIGDSFYDEGGMENLLQAADQYKNFIVFFPTHPKAADAQMKIIAANWKLLHAPDRDQQYTYQAEDSIRKMLDDFPNSDYVPIARQYLREIQERLAEHNYGIGRFYADKGNYAGAKSRFEEIAEKYHDYSAMDEVYYQLGQALEKTQKPDEAAGYYSKIAAAYPFSKYFEEAKQRLDALKKPVPAVDSQLAALNQSKLKPAESWSPLKPLIMFTEALGFKGEPDRYELAKKAVEEGKAEAASAMAAKATEKAGTGEATIEAVIIKDAAGNTQSSTTLGADAAKSNQNATTTSDKKKKTTKNDKKKNT